MKTVVGVVVEDYAPMGSDTFVVLIWCEVVCVSNMLLLSSYLSCLLGNCDRTTCGRARVPDCLVVTGYFAEGNLFPDLGVYATSQSLSDIPGPSVIPIKISWITAMRLCPSPHRSQVIRELCIQRSPSARAKLNRPDQMQSTRTSLEIFCATMKSRGL